MGFKSVMKKVGKIALKAAPIAAAFIPGVGPLASMAIGGLASGASKKLEGGSWKSALGAGALGAGAGYLGGKIPVKGVGPSTGVTKNLTGGLVQASKGAAKGGAKSILGKIGAGTLNSMVGGSGQGDLRDTAMRGIDMAKNYSSGPSRIPNQGGSPEGMNIGGDAMARRDSGIMRGVGPRNAPMSRVDQSSPNLAEYIGQGRREAIRNQPFRSGYDVTTAPEEPAEGDTPMVPAKKVRMPPIYSNYRSGGGGRGRAMGY